ncbi:MarR family winged helix-turn-helix transcriptional regulator [Pseudonocardia sp. MH-G8]|uniref:MarR family winged helix-turn-helix transcriptional regulator n=1 Tax=Pseudonocardia sp. MH-G8 TaxID=1854588 RepID=UPI000BA09BE2|nr:MarR family transcriptional regulator [Pseudonocardia sp. MH-G8]OZM82877.1 MarR family transcriptional regulator [Pseudonocardia sp. MH-G8]
MGVDEALSRTLELAVLVNEDMERGLAGDGLTRSRAHLLWELHQRGPVPQRTLAEALGVTARNITGIVDALVETGFVTREAHPTDRRATLVTPTARGRATAEAMVRGRHELADALFAHMPPVLFDSYVEALEAVLARFKELSGSGSC